MITANKASRLTTPMIIRRPKDRFFPESCRDGIGFVPLSNLFPPFYAIVFFIIQNFQVSGNRKMRFWKNVIKRLLSEPFSWRALTA